MLCGVGHKTLTQYSTVNVAIKTLQILYAQDRSLESTRAHEALVEGLDEVVVLEAAARAFSQPTAVAETGRRPGGRGPGAEDDRRSATAAARAARRAARRGGEHVVRVHGAEDEAGAGRPARRAEPTRDRAAVARRRTDGRPVGGEGAEAGETDGVKVEHAAVVDDRDGDV